MRYVFILIAVLFISGCATTSDPLDGKGPEILEKATINGVFFLMDAAL